MKIRGSTYFFIAIIIILLTFVGLSLADRYYQSRVMPLVVSGISLVLAVIGVVGDVRAKAGVATTAIEGETPAGEKARAELYRYLVVGAWVVGFMLAIYMLGFIIAIPLFLASYTKLHNTGWITAIASALITTAVIYGVFEVALRVELYRGLIFSLS